MNISKISMLGNQSVAELNKREKGASKQTSFSGTQTPFSNISNQQLANALRASSKISFGAYSARPTTVSTQDYEATIANLFKVKQAIVQDKSGDKGNNPAFTVSTVWDNSRKDRTTRIKLDGESKPSIEVLKQGHSARLPEAKFRVGKFAPAVELIDRELGMKVLVLQGGSAKGHDFGAPDKKFEIVNPGPVKTGENSKNISFTGLSKGETQVVTFNREEQVAGATNAYLKGGFHDKVTPGDFVSLMQEDKPTFMILAGGYGTRLYDYTNCKPAALLPTDPNYTLMCNAFDQVAKSGTKLNSPESVVYLTGKGSLEGLNVRTNIQRVDLGDGGCIAQSLANGNTSVDEPLIVLNADTITNADITRAYEAYKRNPDAAILIPYYESPESRAKDFGLMKADAVGNGTLEIKSFVEKPKTLKEAEPAKIEGKDKYMANPGIYIISPQALKSLKEMGFDLKDNPHVIGLAKNFITPLVEKCQQGEFKDADGKPMKCYTALLERKGGGAAFWDDLGKAVTIPEVFRHMAQETKTHGASSPNNLFYGLPEFLLNDAAERVDLKTGVVFMDDKAKEKFAKFQEKYGAQLEGNCVVYSTIDDAA